MVNCCPVVKESVVGERESVGVAVCAVTFTVTLRVTLPPAPEQERVYVVFVVGETDCEPLVALLPVHPSLAVQLVTFVLAHVSVED